MNRRAIVVAMANAGLGLVALAAPGASSFAQRPAHPIQRPPPGRPDGPRVPGRLPDTSGGVAGSASQPGAFTVRAVNKQQNIVQLRDNGGRTGDVYVDPEVYDLSELRPGDEIVVDFLVSDGSNNRLAAAGIWKPEPVRQ